MSRVIENVTTYVGKTCKTPRRALKRQNVKASGEWLKSALRASLWTIDAPSRWRFRNSTQFFTSRDSVATRVVDNLRNASLRAIKWNWRRQQKYAHLASSALRRAACVRDRIETRRSSFGGYMGAISAYEKQGNDQFYRFDLSVNDCLRLSLHDSEFYREELQIIEWLQPIRG
jgi:hypothetical protein